MTLFTQARARLQAAHRRRDELTHLASLPDYLLRDMGLMLDGRGRPIRDPDAEARR